MTETAAEVAGRNARAIRRAAGVHLEDFARAARPYGLRWSTSKVSAFESGRRAPAMETLIAVAAGLSDMVGHSVTLADLFAGTGEVQMNDGLSVPLTAVRAALGSGEPVVKLDGVVIEGPTADFVETDELVCKRIGVTPEVGAEAMFRLWGCTFTAERNRRAEPDANHAHRGQIARKLQAELAAETE
jgi:transcriptional regulator with XRE-family HTH domain